MDELQAKISEVVGTGNFGAMGRLINQSSRADKGRLLGVLAVEVALYKGNMSHVDTLFKMARKFSVDEYRNLKLLETGYAAACIFCRNRNAAQMVIDAMLE